MVSLYDAKSNRCGTCGRRFPTTAEGKEKKARHLDWHFKTNQRMVDASKRAQNRSWYVDERVRNHTIHSPFFCLWDIILTRHNRTGLNPARLVMIQARLTMRPQATEKLEQMANPQNKDRPRHGLGHRTMLNFATHPVPSARKCLNRLGRKMSRTGFGRTPSKWLAGSITPVVMPKLRQMARHRAARHRKDEAAHRTRSWVSGRRREMTPRDSTCGLRWSLHEIICIIKTIRVHTEFNRVVS